MPNFAAGKFFETGLGTGVLGRASLFPVAGLASPDRGTYSYLLLRYSPTVTSTQLAHTREVLDAAGCADPSCVLTDARPLEIEGFRNAKGLPLAIGLVLALLLLATLTHVLLTTLRRRQTDLAVLRGSGARRANSQPCCAGRRSCLSGSASSSAFRSGWRWGSPRGVRSPINSACRKTSSCRC